jgi:hypothetical protein
MSSATKSPGKTKRSRKRPFAKEQELLRSISAVKSEKESKKAKLEANQSADAVVIAGIR